MKWRIGSLAVAAAVAALVIALPSPGTEAEPVVTTAAKKKPKRFDRAKRLRIRGVGGSQQNPCFSPDGNRLVVTQWRAGYNEGLANVLLIGRESGRRLKLLSREAPRA